MMKTVIFAVCSCLAIGSLCLADDYSWVGAPGSGVFGTAANWITGVVPGAEDRAFFTFLNMPYTVTFDHGYENNAMIVDGADATLDLNGSDYYLNCDPGEGPAATIGESNTSEISSLSLVNGTVYSREVVIGLWEGTQGHLTLSGSAAQWTTDLNGWHGVSFGQFGGDAMLEVLDGAQFRHGHGASAIDWQSDAAIGVDGGSSQWYVDGQFDMSIRGRTTVDVTNGGLVNIGKLTMALERGSSAQINVTGQNQQLGLQLHAGSENSLTIGKNGMAAIRVSGSSLWNQGTMTLGENAGSSGHLEIHEGTTVFCDNSVAVGGNFDRAGGAGRIELIDDTPGNGIETEFRVQASGQEYIKVWPKGTIAMDGGSITVQNNLGQPNPIILQGGTIEGNGVIWGHVENHGGLVVPSEAYNGNRLSFAFDYTQDAAGTLKIALGSNVNYPAIQVNNPSFGQATLDGMLDVDLVDGFVPEYEDRFEIVRATTVNGTFINAAATYVFQDGRFEVEYNSDSVVLTHYTPTPACPRYPAADLNKDCQVNLADFAMFAAQWLNCNLVPEFDCPGNGVIIR